VTVKLSNSARSDEANGIRSAMAAGKIRIYDGTRPASPNDAVTSQTLLVEFDLDSPAYATAVDGVITLAGVPIQATAVATSTATWVRFVESSGTTVVMDMDIGVSGTDFIIADTSITVGMVCEITSHTYTVPEA